MKLEYSWQIFEIISDITFDQNPPCGSRIIPCGRTDTKQIVAFLNFANVRNNASAARNVHVTVTLMMMTKERHTLQVMNR